MRIPTPVPLDRRNHDRGWVGRPPTRLHFVLLRRNQRVPPGIRRHSHVGTSTRAAGNDAELWQHGRTPCNDGTEIMVNVHSNTALAIREVRRDPRHGACATVDRGLSWIQFLPAGFTSRWRIPPRGRNLLESSHGAGPTLSPLSSTVRGAVVCFGCSVIHCARKHVEIDGWRVSTGIRPGLLPVARVYASNRVTLFAGYSLFSTSLYAFFDSDS